mgnify:CR=1 FL=1
MSLFFGTGGDDAISVVSSLEASFKISFLRGAVCLFCFSNMISSKRVV